MKRLAVVGAIVLVLFGCGIAVLLATRDDRTGDNATLEVIQDNDEKVDYDYVIPAGTQDRKLGGETVEIMPPTLDVEVGESIRIRNDDPAPSSGSSTSALGAREHALHDPRRADRHL